MSEGWIKIHRKITEWEWYGNPKVITAFLHCIIKANHKDKRWRGKLIKRGQFITGISEFGQQTGLSYQEVRTAWRKLEATGEITTKSTNKGTTVTVCNYSSYQDVSGDFNKQSNKQANKRATNKQQTNNKQITTTKNEKNIKNEKNTISSVTSDELPHGSVDPHLWKQAMELSHHLRDRVIEMDPDHRYAHNPPSLQSWYVELERAMRLDGRTYRQLKFIIDYIFTRSTKVAIFWQPNVQSGPTLRKQFDQLKSQIKQEVKNEKPSDQQTVKKAVDAVEKIDWED